MALLLLGLLSCTQAQLPQNELELGTFTSFLPSNSSCAFSGCGQAPPQFQPSDNICQVDGEDLPVDCSCVGNSSTPLPKNPCPGCPPLDSTGRLFFDTIQEALMRCPYDPLILEVSGTHVVGRLMFPDTEGIIYVRGFPTQLIIQNCSEVNDTDVIEAFQMANPGLNFTFLLNVTFERIPVQGSPPATLVGSNWKVLNPNSSITFENLTINGCCTTEPLFQLCGWEETELLNGCCETNLTLQPTSSPSPSPSPDLCLDSGDFLDFCNSELGFRMDCSRWFTPPGPCILGGEFVPNCPPQPTQLFNCSASPGGTVDGVWSCNWEPAWKRLINCEFRVDPSAPFRTPPKPPGSCLNCPQPETEEFEPCDPPVVNKTEPVFCRGCLTNNNFTLLNSTVQNFKGEFVIKLYAFEENVNLRVEDSVLADIPGHAIHAQGLNSYIINRNCFARCGGLTSSCIFLKGNFISRSEFQLTGNQHFLTNRSVPFPCSYSLNGEVRCINGFLECLDFVNT